MFSNFSFHFTFCSHCLFWSFCLQIIRQLFLFPSPGVPVHLDSVLPPQGESSLWEGVPSPCGSSQDHQVCRVHGQWTSQLHDQEVSRSRTTYLLKLHDQSSSENYKPKHFYSNFWYILPTLQNIINLLNSFIIQSSSANRFC